MILEVVVQSSLWITSILIMWILVPRNKIIEAHLVFLFIGVLTWPVEIIVQQFHLIEYPIPLMSITLGYLFFPAFSVLYVVKFPNISNKVIITLYAIGMVSFPTLCEFYIERYTDLLEYHHWSWYWTWIQL